MTKDAGSRDGASPRPAVSIVVPVLNEAAFIAPRLAALAAFRRAGAEVIVVDGGSADATCALAAPHADAVAIGARGRAVQMNLGARTSHGAVLVFLHADTRLPNTALDDIRIVSHGGKRWGRFDVAIDGKHPLLVVVAMAMNLRSRLTGIATGDQAMFVTRDEFDAVGGFPEIALMEDIALSSILRRRSRPACLARKAVTSGRRWDVHGFWRTVALMWALRFLFACGVPPRLLATLYGYR